MNQIYKQTRQQQQKKSNRYGHSEVMIELKFVRNLCLQTASKPHLIIIKALECLLYYSHSRQQN